MNKWINILVSLLAVFYSNFVMAETNDPAIFQKIFNDWTEAFNQKNAAKACALFSPAVEAYYQGVPKRNYADICDGFKKIFSRNNERYQYVFNIQQVYSEATLAAVRITWYLNVYENNKLKSRMQDEGIDIFQKNKDGVWQIVNYIAFPVIQWPMRA